MNSLAIKLDVSDNNQRDLNDLLIRVGIKPQRRRFHCTVGFMDKVFESHEEAEEFSEKLNNRLNLQNPLPFQIHDIRFLFHHIVALIPNEPTHEALKLINEQVRKQVLSLSSGSHDFNTQTSKDGYHPHITLWRQRHKNRRFKQAQEELNKGRLPPLELVEYSYTIL